MLARVENTLISQKTTLVAIFSIIKGENYIAENIIRVTEDQSDSMITGDRKKSTGKLARSVVFLLRHLGLPMNAPSRI